MLFSCRHITYAFVTSAVAVAICINSVNSQEPRPKSQCPSISVSCPSQCPKTGEDIEFKAAINGGQLDSLAFHWSVAGGRIIDGQGTDKLTVRVDNGCDSTTASVEVLGSTFECRPVASCSTVTDCCSVALAEKFDELGEVTCERESAHFSRLIKHLENQPTSRGYIIFYGGRSYRNRLARLGESEARANRLKTYFSDRIETGRVVVISGGFRETWSVDLWIVPSGAVEPQPTPTVNEKDIRFRRGTIRKDEYKCPEP